MTVAYETFLEEKAQVASASGFEPVFMPARLFDFQEALVEWSLRQGRGAEMADCGMGKTPMQLAWAENVHRKTNKPVLVVTPLAVAEQTIREGEKFGIEVHRSRDGRDVRGIVVTNYERLHHFNPDDFGGLVGDESSILKSFEGVTRAAVTEFMRVVPYRLLCTATAAPCAPRSRFRAARDRVGRSRRPRSRGRRASDTRAPTRQPNARTAAPRVA